MFAEFTCQGLAQRDDSTLASTIDGFIVFADPACIRADVDDFAVGSLDHRRRHGTYAMDRTPQIYGDLFIEIFIGFVKEQCVVGPASVVDQDVDLPKSFQRALCHVLYLFTVSNIGFYKQHFSFATRSLQFVDDTLSLVFVDINDDDIGSFHEETLGDGLSDIGCPAGDNCGLACQS